MRKHWGVWLVLTGAFLSGLIWLTAAPAPQPVRYPDMPFSVGGAPREPRHRPTTPTSTSPTSTGRGAMGNHYAGPSDFWLGFWKVMGVLYFVVQGGFLVWLLVRVVRSLLVRRKAEPTTDYVEIPGVPASLVEDPEVFRSLLAQGEVTDAIVACWAQLEDATREAGVPIETWETSSEYTERVIGAWVSNPDALRRLSALYREARFSRHQLGEDARAAASSALDEVLNDLRRTWRLHHAPA